MTTDKTPATLATVKHGGCVQLGDAPFAWSERAKSDALEEGQYAFTEADGKDLGYTACIEACVDAICSVLALAEHRTALSAQPSPGGQGDAVRALPAEWRARAEELSVHDAIGLTHRLKLKDCADELDVALASMPPSPAMGVTDAMVHAYSQAYDKNWEAQLRAPEDAPELGTFFAMRAGLQAALAAPPAQAVNRDQAAAWVPAKFFSDGVVAMTARRAPPSAMAVGLHGEYLPLFRQPPHAMALPEDAEEVSASLGDDAAAMLDANPEDERALNMQRAAEILDAQINAQVMPE